MMHLLHRAHVPLTPCLVLKPPATSVVGLRNL